MEELEIKKIYKLLKEVDFLYKLTMEEINLLIGRLEKLTYKKGTAVVKQGGRGASFFLISEGKMAVWVVRPDGRKMLIRHLGEGDIFGEMSLLTGERRTATVITEEKTVLYSLSKNEFKHILVNNPGIIEEISNIVSMRQDQLDRESERVIEKESLLKKIATFFNID